MSEIYAEEISVNPNAPRDAASVQLFGYNGMERMTLAQLVNAITVRRCCLVERQSVIQMNQIASGSEKIDSISEAAEWVLGDGASCRDWTTDATGSAYYRLLITLLSESGSTPDVPRDLTVYANRMDVFEHYRTLLESLNSSIDRIAVDLESSVSRRDALYNLSTTICTHAFGAMGDMASTLSSR